MCVLVAQSCPTVCDPMDWGPPGFSVHGLLQSRILDWIAILFSRGTSQPRDWTLVSGIAGRFFYHLSYREVLNLALINNREGIQPHPSTENWIKDLLNMTLPIRTRPSLPLSQSLPSGSFHKPLTLLHQRADWLKTTITGNRKEYNLPS